MGTSFLIADSASTSLLSTLTDQAGSIYTAVSDLAGTIVASPMLSLSLAFFVAGGICGILRRVISKS